MRPALMVTRNTGGWQGGTQKLRGPQPNSQPRRELEPARREIWKCVLADQEMRERKHHHLDGVNVPAVQEEMIEGRQRDQGHRRSAEHRVEYGDEKLRNTELHATRTFTRLQCNIAVAGAA
jgi:hypothetical protein